MDEQRVYALELSGLFPEYDDVPRVSGTAGEIFEKIADEWDIDDKDEEVDIPIEGVYPSVRAFKVHQMLEDQLGKSARYVEPDELIEALIKEGLIRPLTETEYEDWVDEEDQEEYEEARMELDEEWTDGLWET